MHLVVSAVAAALISAGWSVIPRAHAPTFSPVGGSYTSTQTVTVTTTSTGSPIYCSVDGSAPQHIEGQRYTGPLSVGTTQTIICVAWPQFPRERSRPSSATYTISTPPPPPPPPSSTWVSAAGAPCTNTSTTSCEWAACKEEPLQGTVRYYCDCQTGAASGCTVGVDTNSGLTPALARRTVGNARTLFSTLPAGQTIAFCRGGSFGSAAGQWENANATQASPLTVRDYTAPWNVGTEGRPRMTGQISLFNIASHYRFKNIRLSGSDNFGFQGLAGSNDMEFCNMELDGSYGYAFYPAGSPPADNWRIIGSRILNTRSGAFLGGSAGNWLISNYMWNNGNLLTTFDHTIYFGGQLAAPGGTDEIIKCNEIHAPANTPGAVIVVHGRHTGTLIEDNYIDFSGGVAAPGGYGISTAPGYTTTELLSSLTVRGNQTYNAGDRSFDILNCQGCLVENNVAVKTNAANDYVFGVAGRYYDSGGGDAHSANNVIRNNTVYTNQASTNGTYSVGKDGTGHVFRNNAAYSTGGACFSIGAGVASPDYNLCYNVGSNPGANSINANPLFVSAPTNLRPGPGSPLVGEGDPNQKPDVDYEGETRPTPPSIGAYEPVAAPIPLAAFPGCQGSGCVSVGGRGGSIIYVTSLADSGANTLRACIQATGSRTCVFRVAGTIVLQSTMIITNANITIAGQTSPGGIQVRAAKAGETGGPFTGSLLISKANNVVMRYMRFRHGKTIETGETIQSGAPFKIQDGGRFNVIDHNSFYWTEDENINTWSFTTALRDITYSWNIVTEPLIIHATNGAAGAAVGSGIHSGMVNLDYHHNFLGTASHRNPNMTVGEVKWINNVVYNYGFRGTQLGGAIRADLISNIYKLGPKAPSLGIREFIWRNDPAYSGNPSLYVSGNSGPRHPDPGATSSEWTDMVGVASSENGADTGPLNTAFRRTTQLTSTSIPIVPEPVSTLETSMGLTTTTVPFPVGASRRLTANGAWVTAYDSNDSRVVQEYRTNTGPSQYPTDGTPSTITGSTPYPDADLDGMSDTWETANGLNPANANDRNTVHSTGYRMLDFFLAGMSVP